VKIGDTLTVDAAGGALATGASLARAVGTLAAFGALDLDEAKASMTASVTPVDAMMPRLQTDTATRARFEVGRRSSSTGAVGSGRAVGGVEAFLALTRLNGPSRSRTNTLRSPAGMRRVGVGGSALLAIEGVVPNRRVSGASSGPSSAF
jgi:hypothetical protein